MCGSCVCSYGPSSQLLTAFWYFIHHLHTIQCKSKWQVPTSSLHSLPTMSQRGGRGGEGWERTTTRKCCLVPAGIAISTSVLVFRASTLGEFGYTIMFIVPAALLAFMLGVSEYLLVYHTSGLTLSISGVLKVSVCPIRGYGVSIGMSYLENT